MRVLLGEAIDESVQGVFDEITLEIVVKMLQATRKQFCAVQKRRR